MGTLTLTQLAAEVQAGLGNRTDFSLSSSRTVPILNIAQTRLSRAYDWMELQNIVNLTTSFTNTPSSDKFLTLPNTVKNINAIVLYDSATPTTLSRKLIGKTVGVFDRLWPAPEALPIYKPKFYTRWGYQLTLYPVPDAAYPVKVRATNYPTAFSSGNASAVSDFDQKDDILINLALEYAWRSLGQHDKADQYQVMALSQIKDAVKFNNTMQADLSSTENDVYSQDVVGQYWLNPFVMSMADVG